MSNVIASLTYGRRFEYDDPRLHKLIDRALKGLQEDSGFAREVRGGGAKEPRRASCVEAASALKRASRRRAWGRRGRGSTEGPGRKGIPRQRVWRRWGDRRPGAGEAGPGSRSPGEGPGRNLYLLHWKPLEPMRSRAPSQERGSRPELREEPLQWWGHPGGGRDLADGSEHLSTGRSPICGPPRP